MVENYIATILFHMVENYTNHTHQATLLLKLPDEWVCGPYDFVAIKRLLQRLERLRIYSGHQRNNIHDIKSSFIVIAWFQTVKV